MDSIFGEEREVMTFNVLVRHPERSLTADKEFNDVVEYILIYSKSEEFIMPKIDNHTQEKLIDFIFDHFSKHTCIFIDHSAKMKERCTEVIKLDS